MARPKKAIGLDAENPLIEDIKGDTLIDGMNKAYQQEQQNRLIAKETGTITLPGGATRRVSDLIELIDHEYIPERHESVFSKPENYIREVEPGFMYAWPALADSNAAAKVRSGEYIPVTRDEIRDDTSTPIEFKERAGIRVACVGDVFLVKIPPRAVKKNYRSREAQAILRTAHNQSFRELQNHLQDISGGMVSASLDINE